MELTWSHAVLNVRNPDAMLDFYTRVLGFQIADQGQLPGGQSITFLSQCVDEHHQLAMIDSREDSDPPNSLNHLAFRTPAYEDVKELHEKLRLIDGSAIRALSHGNTLSVYFKDPEGNGVEVFWDTPWHVGQPQVEAWDISMDKDEALEWVRTNFGDEATFEPREAYSGRRRQGAD